jgi:hypothetical protein
MHEKYFFIISYCMRHADELTVMFLVRYNTRHEDVLKVMFPVQLQYHTRRWTY